MRDTKDRRWANEVAEKADSILRSESDFEHSSVLSLECSKTMCGVEVKHEKEEYARKFMMTFPLQMATTGVRGGTAYLEPEELITRFYLAREGTKLPSRHDPY